MPNAPAQGPAQTPVNAGVDGTLPGKELHGGERRGSFGGSSKVKILKPFNTANIKILLLENVNETAVSTLRNQGYQVRSPIEDGMDHLVL